VIFDLDGVVTRTALVHSAAWKRMFDQVLEERERDHGEPFRAFTHEGDYLPFVDGRPRYDGVATFLDSRGITLPWGDPSDEPGSGTVCAVGNRKNAAFHAILERDGVAVYESTVALIHALRGAGVRVGIASSSRNARPVLAAAGLLPLMETVIDGLTSAERGLAGKPAPDIFVTAAAELGCPPDRCAVVEDAVSGVRAGAAGGFGLVLGVARENNADALWDAGADQVVDDLEGFGLDALREWFVRGVHEDGWTLSYRGFDPAREGHREVLLAVGNGYLGTRGAAEEADAGGGHYPATYLAGVYDRANSRVGDRDVDNEDLVNAVNWLPTRLRVDSGPWIGVDHDGVVACRRVLDLRTGVLSRELTLRCGDRDVRVESLRLASMDDRHLLALRTRVTVSGGPAKVELDSGLDGGVINDGVARYRSLERRHLAPVTAGAEGERMHLLSRTRESSIQIATAARLDARVDGEAVDVDWRAGHGGTTRVGLRGAVDLAAGQTLQVDKRVAIHTSRDGRDPLARARATLDDAPGLGQALTDSATRWAELWEQVDVRVDGDRLAQKLMRLHLYHLLVSYSPCAVDLDVGITARGLHGEAYRGHVFWDELFIQPLFAMHLPAVSRAMLMYRHRRLPKARELAAAEGLGGAMFPWQSGSDGAEETQATHLNPLSGQWDLDHSRRQRHVSLAVAYDVWQHAAITGDRVFLAGPGGELLVDIARFWASLAREGDDGRVHVRGVMGPDEFHEAIPGAEGGGLDDNAYTNLMLAWLMETVEHVLNDLDAGDRAALMARTGLDEGERERWTSLGRRLHVPMSDDGVLEQYAGYFRLAELDWEHYRAEYNDIHRMDRVLKAEGRSPDDYQVAKQADALMVFYNLPEPRVAALLGRLGRPVPDDLLARNLAYYLPRTSHGSTLSRVVHALLATRAGDRELGWTLYREALTSDLDDIQGGTTAEGIHTGVMAGTVMITLRAYAGLVLGGDTLALAPRLPRHWRRLAFGLHYRGDRYELEITPDGVSVRARDARHGTIQLESDHVPLRAGHWIRWHREED